MEKFSLRLNPKKCAFGVISGKLLGYIVSKKGIEVDPAKVKAIMEMQPPKNISQMRTLQGRVHSIRCFISQLADISQPFTKTLHKGVTFTWSEECENNFNHIKKYLSNPPILMPPIQGKPLILYVSTIDASLGALLAQHDENKKERAIYYISRTLVAYEKNYSMI